MRISASPVCRPSDGLKRWIHISGQKHCKIAHLLNSMHGSCSLLPMLIFFLGSGYGGRIALMCLKNSDAPHPNVLHKIGLLELDEGNTKLVFKDTLPHISCTLSGCEGALEDGYFNFSWSNPLV